MFKTNVKKQTEYKRGQQLKTDLTNRRCMDCELVKLKKEATSKRWLWRSDIIKKQKY